jgi:hypothetical protein
MYANLFTAGLVSLTILAPTSVAFAQFSRSLDVPQTGQATDFYCGAASSQMTMMGYPAASHRQCVQQVQIYSTIQNLKQDQDFYSDPDGIRGAIKALDPPPGDVDFAISSNADRDTVMHDILYWIADRNYPSAVLVQGGDHWVVVTGFKTDVDPRTGSAVLQELTINDPWPPATAPQHNPCIPGSAGDVGGVVRTVTGSSWYGNDWRNPNHYGTKWLNKYVAIVGLAQAQGTVTANEGVDKGEVIPTEKAIRVAQEYVDQHKLFERYPDLQKARAYRALLVNKALNGYFLVPFESEGGKSRFVVLINAYSGEFEEFGVLNNPVKYLNEIDVLAKVESSIKTTTNGPLSNVNAELVYHQSPQMKNRYLPVWKFTAKAGEIPITRYVTDSGEVLNEITQLPLQRTLGGQ